LAKPAKTSTALERKCEKPPSLSTKTARSNKRHCIELKIKKNNKALLFKNKIKKTYEPWLIIDVFHRFGVFEDR